MLQASQALPPRPSARADCLWAHCPGANNCVQRPANDTCRPTAFCSCRALFELWRLIHALKWEHREFRWGVRRGYSSPLPCRQLLLLLQDYLVEAGRE